MASTQESKVALLLDLHCELGEAPTWDDRMQRFYFVDIKQELSAKGQIHALEADGSLFSIELPENVGTIALTSNPNLLLAALHRRVVLVDVAKRSVVRTIATVSEEHGIENMRFNDGKATPGGAFIVGRMHMGWRDGNPGRLYRLRWDKPAEGHFEELLSHEEVQLPNGMAWEEGTMYFADTGNRTLTAYQTDDVGVPVKGPDGQGLKGRLVATIPDNEGAGPDGICLDSQGNIWAALADNGAVASYSSKTGEQVHKVALPVKNVTACTFGGPDLDVLYVTSQSEEGEHLSEHRGGVFTARIPGVKGVAPAYKVQIPQDG